MHIRRTSAKTHVIAIALVATMCGLCFIASGGAQTARLAPTATPRPTRTPTPPPTPAPTATPVSELESPEKPFQAVCHNGMVLCVLSKAAEAHISHGDTPLGTCPTQGNFGPCPP